MREYAVKKRRKRGIISTLFPIVIILAGIVLLARPVVTDWWAAKQASESISEITSVYNDMDDPDRIANLEQAQAWNASLKGELDESYELWDYDTQLTYRGTPSTMMAYIDIPKIATKLPIYHYTTEEVLSAGVGHIEWSALPVGGAGTRCLLSAHSGMQNTRMFDDIRKLEIGDTFVLWTLSEPYCYRVCDIKTILPEEVETCMPESGRDLCSLITCTPYGVNSHRLVVTGERCEYVPEETGITAPVEAYVNRRTTPLLIGCGALVVLLVFIIVMAALRRRRARRAQ